MGIEQKPGKPVQGEVIQEMILFESGPLPLPFGREIVLARAAYRQQRDVNRPEARSRKWETIIEVHVRKREKDWDSDIFRR